MKENRNEVEIKSTAEHAWHVLTDLEKYAEWNPLLYRGAGKVELGEKIVVYAKTASKDMKFNCEVVQVVPNQEFAWVFHVIHPFLFRGKHIFRIEPIGDGKIKFIDREQFEGLLLPMQAKDLQTNGLAAMDAMGLALKKRLERSLHS